MKRRIVLMVVLLLFYAELFAQALAPNGRLQINLDYAQFRNDQQTNYFEIYYAFYPNHLSYDFSNDQYNGGVTIHAKLTNNDTREMIIDKQVTLPIAIKDTNSASYRYPFASQAGFVVPFGNYRLKVIAADLLNSARQDSVLFPISFSSYPSALSCSDLELCCSVKASQKKNDPFYKNALEVVPNATLIFGVTEHPLVFYYLELYNLEAEKTYQVKKVIKDTQGKLIRESLNSRKFGVSNATEVGMTNITSLYSGKYLYAIEISDTNSQLLAKREKAFFVFNPHLKIEPQEKLVVEKNQFSGLTGEQLSEEFQQAKYIATDEEIQLFSQLTNEEGKRQFLSKFWAKILGGRLGRPPMDRLQYLSRVEQANEMYATVGKKGWQTDRGRVYILYGKPDDIERFPSISEYKPYEIWRYHKIENGVEFVFIDRLGFGNYLLYHSTKRGELRDDNWQENLR